MGYPYKIQPFASALIVQSVLTLHAHTRVHLKTENDKDNCVDQFKDSFGIQARENIADYIYNY